MNNTAQNPTNQAGSIFGKIFKSTFVAIPVSPYTNLYPVTSTTPPYIKVDINPSFNSRAPLISKYSVNNTIKTPVIFTVTTAAHARIKLFFKLFSALAEDSILETALSVNSPSLINTFKIKLTFGNTRNDNTNQRIAALSNMPGTLTVPFCILSLKKFIWYLPA